MSWRVSWSASDTTNFPSSVCNTPTRTYPTLSYVVRTTFIEAIEHAKLFVAMEQPSPKRRKLSPSQSTQASRETLSKPTRNNVRNPSHRASFMSPTKASLAKFNPSILNQIASEPRRRSGRVNAARSSLSAIATPRPPKSNSSPTIAAGLQGVDLSADEHHLAHRKKGVTSNIHAAPRLLQSSPERNTTASPPKNLEGSLQSHVRRRSNDQGERTEGRRALEEFSLNKVPRRRPPFTPTQNSLASRKTSDIAEPRSQEPSLPSTPSQLGLEDPPEQPKGLAFSTPSKRAKRKDTSGGKRPSPLKGQTIATETSPSARRAQLELGPKSYLSFLPKPSKPLEGLQKREKDEQIEDIEQDLLETEHHLITGGLISQWQKADHKGRKDMTRWKKSAMHSLNRCIQSRESVKESETLPERFSVVAEHQAPATLEV